MQTITTQNFIFTQKEVAMQYLHKKHLEPTRSILFVSAANLAISCGLLAEAQMLAKYGLSCKRGLLGNHNQQIKELKMIFNNATKQYQHPAP
jgi:hypothetical protein